MLISVFIISALFAHVSVCARTNICVCLVAGRYDPPLKVFTSIIQGECRGMGAVSALLHLGDVTACCLKAKIHQRKIVE